MYDPDGDYQRDDSESTAATAPCDDSLPSEQSSFCPRCGHELTQYTWQSIEGLAFCVTCIADQEADCLNVFGFLGGTDWTAILVEHNAVLWLSPTDHKWHNSGIEAITQRLAFERQYGTALNALS